jgi:hypothetical protein
MRRLRRILSAGAASVALVASTTGAAAEPPDREACVAAYEGAQVSMRRGSLKAAREQLGVCLSESCAKSLRSDCAQWLNEVEARLPSVILACEGPDGRARVDVRVAVDGVPFADRLDGKGLEIDPGEHAFRFELPGEPPLETRYVVIEGDKVQRVVARFTPHERPAPARPVPWATYALTGVGVAAAAGFGVAALAGLAGKDDLDRCKPDCAHPDVVAVRTKFIAADVLLAVSVISLGAAAYLYLTRGSAPSRDAALGLLANGSTF